MRRSALPLACGLLAAGLVTVPSPTPVGATLPASCSVPTSTGHQPSFTYLGRYTVGGLPSGETAAEIVAQEGARLYVMNVASLDIVNIGDPTNPVRIATITLPNDPTSVAVKNGLVAVAVPAAVDTDPGQVLFFKGTRQVGAVQVGSLPDMVTFTPDGSLLLVANEGQPNSYGQPDSVDPEGSVSIIATAPFRGADRRRHHHAEPRVTTVGFADFNAGGRRSGELPADVRISGPGASVAQDLEPEYITVSDDGRWAWVSLQENNAIAKIDVRRGRVERIIALGYSDHSLPGFGIDASDKDNAINIANWPVKGMYMPDGVANYRVGGETFVLTANEGDAREYDGMPGGADVQRAKDVADLSLFPEAASNAALARLNVTTVAPATVGPDGKLTSLYSLGSRSFSIRTANGDLVWDSGDDFECLTADLYPATFNASNSNDTFDNRSDDKGPEPESVVVGKVGRRTYAFIALERIGGVMVYDITDPHAPTFVQHLMTRTFGGAEVGPDSGPEGLVFVPAAKSPTHQAMVIYGNEVTGTAVLWGIGA
ncbi:MAG: choice-of-anchor I family protein [Ilumatobacteraceae bacterium]|nr:choice-of-anchor I family protein [Ilumatobacter sp.]MCB0983412.1 choice-of-anchor I family protein [Ilumatobacter sp.]